MRQIITRLLYCLCLLWGCTSSHDSKASRWGNTGKLKVLCTTSMVQKMVEGVGGEYVDCIALIQGESDPHSYQLVKGDDDKLAEADLLFFNGLGLEHGPSLASFLDTSPKAYALGE